MQAIILKCKPRSQFHFGKVALDEDTSLDDTSLIFHSDTLFSALVNIYDKVFGNEKQETDAFVKLFGGKIHISSGFYCLEKSDNQGFIYFLPKPIIYNLARLENSLEGKHKDLKSIEYISLGIWQQGLDIENFLSSDCIIIDKQFACLKSEISLSEEQIKKLKISEINTLPKVKVRAESKEDSIYYQTNVQMADNGNLGYKPHFYFLIKGEIDTKLKTCLQILAETGIGGEKSAGCGYFESLQIESNFPEIKFDNANLFCSLSLVNPDITEFKQVACYQPIFRGGRRLGQQNSKQYLDQVRMMKEGAILSSDIKGRLVDVSTQKDKSYLRNGLNFSLPIHPNLTKYV